MTKIRSLLLQLGAGTLLLHGCSVLAEGPLPEFTYQGIALDPEELNWCPTEEIEHPAFIKMEGLIEKPLAKYYLYYGPHKHAGVGLAYSDSLAGPWTEYEGNPLIEGCAAPDIRWVEEKAKFYLWAHAKNSQTECWTSDDGIHFVHQGVSIQASEIGTKNSTYTRFYEYPIERYGNKYIMLYVGFGRDEGIRSIYLAHSIDAENWMQLPEPIVEPGEGETSALYDPALFQWEGRHYIVYADNNVWRGGTLKYVEIDKGFTPVGSSGRRYVFMEGPASLQGRLRSPEFLVEGSTIHMISGGGKSPRVIVYAVSVPDPKSKK